MLMVQKKNWLGKYLFYNSKCNGTACNFLLLVCLKWLGCQLVSFTMLYSKPYILTELNVNDVKFISVDRQKLDISRGVSYLSKS